MRKTGLLIALTAPLYFGACSSSITDAISGDLQDRIDTLSDCFEPLFEKVDKLFDIIQTWRLNTSQPIPDPAGLNWSQAPLSTATPAGDGSINALYASTVGDFDVTMKFYSPTGDEVTDIDLSAAATLNEAIDIAATMLRNRFPGDVDKYIIAEWSVVGAGLTGQGALTGVIGGTANQNELELLVTTAIGATPTGGNLPTAAASTVTITGMQTCELTFETRAPEHLETDTSPTQEYPDGVINGTVTGASAVSVTIVFDGTVNARVSIDGASATFNLETLDLSGFST